MIEMGATVPWSVEVCQQDGAAGAEHVRRSVIGMRRVLDDARLVARTAVPTDDEDIMR
jgi:hypothetical protein